MGFTEVILPKENAKAVGDTPGAKIRSVKNIREALSYLVE